MRFQPAVINDKGELVDREKVRSLLKQMRYCYLCEDRAYTVRFWRPTGIDALKIRAMFEAENQPAPGDPALYALCKFHAFRPDADAEVHQHLLAQAHKIFAKWN